ncbi:MAG: hypothetical protein Q8P61_02180 [Candidatus Nanopelagicales bacterium]|nr:hypothetical protein [Candidatus Nanopelagicales bacterium]
MQDLNDPIVRARVTRACQLLDGIVKCPGHPSGIAIRLESVAVLIKDAIERSWELDNSDEFSDKSEATK